MTGHDARTPVAGPPGPGGPAGPALPARRGVEGDGWAGAVLGAALVAMTLVAGLSFTFAAAVMPNLAGADDRTFVATMQRFNENPVFPLAFTGALVVAALAVVLERRHGPGAALRWAVAALVLYGVALAVTAGVHLPLNDEIDRAGGPAGIADLAEARDRFEGPWVAANIVRTLLCLGAVAALARALVLHGRGTAGAAGGVNVPGRWQAGGSTGRAGGDR